jgi:uncharacterized protein YlxW (UPF0749 family)
VLAPACLSVRSQAELRQSQQDRESLEARLDRLRTDVDVFREQCRKAHEAYQNQVRLPQMSVGKATGLLSV